MICNKCESGIKYKLKHLGERLYCASMNERLEDEVVSCEGFKEYITDDKPVENTTNLEIKSEKSFWKRVFNG